MIFQGSSETVLLPLRPCEMLSSLLCPSPKDELQRRGRGGEKKREEIGFHNTLKA